MQLTELLPRPLRPEAGDETPTLMNSLFARVHLDRRLARRLGWRGLRPSFSHGPAWTLRSAESNALYGFAFLDEEAGRGVITGRFALYVFPTEDSVTRPEQFPASAAALARAPEFMSAVRELSANADRFADFILGELALDVAVDGSGLALTLTAKKSRALELMDGSVLRTAPLRALGPIWALISASLREILKEEGEAVLWAERVPAEREAPSGTVFDESKSELLVSLTLALGAFKGRLPGRRMKALHFSHRPHEEELQTRPVVHVLTGFLGSGKTTFLRAWLEFLNGREQFTGVIQNEFGEADLDSLVLSGQTRVEALDEGCICCTLADSLRPGIMRLIETTPAEQFILETTGVADPANVEAELLTLNDLVERGLVIALLDSVDLAEHPEHWSETADGGARMKQILNADVIVMSKADAVEAQVLEEMMARVHELNSDALVVPAFHGQIPFAVLEKFYFHWLDRQGRPMPSKQSPKHLKSEEKQGFLGLGRRGWAAPKAEANAEDFFEERVERFERPVTLDEVRGKIEEEGAGLRRMKGIVELAGEGPVVMHWAAGRWGYEPADGDVVAALRRDAQRKGTLPENGALPGFLVFIRAKNSQTPAGMSSAAKDA